MGVLSRAVVALVLAAGANATPFTAAPTMAPTPTIASVAPTSTTAFAPGVTEAPNETSVATTTGGQSMWEPTVAPGAVLAGCPAVAIGAIGDNCTEECFGMCPNVTTLYNASKKYVKDMCSDPDVQNTNCEQLYTPIACCYEGRCGTAEECNEKITYAFDQIELLIKRLLGFGVFGIVLCMCCGCICCCCICGGLYACFCGGKEDKRHRGALLNDDEDESYEEDEGDYEDEDE